MAGGVRHHDCFDRRPLASTTPGTLPAMSQVVSHEQTFLAPGQAAIEALRINGTTVVFGLNGDHVLKLYEGLADTPSIRHVIVKHENNAALAAEAYGRLSERPGVVVVTAGPGALNSISGIASAYASGAPIVHLSGAVPTTAALETFHGVDEVDFTERMFAPVTKWSTRVTDAASIVPTINRAFRLAVDGRPAPVHVEITRDLLESPARVVAPSRPEPAPSASPAGDLDATLARMRAARNPLIIAGKGAWYPTASAALVRFAEALGAPVAWTWEGHGAMPTMHPLALGPFRLMGTHPAVDAAIARADLVLGVGLRPGIEAHRAVQEAVGERLTVLGAADVPNPHDGPVILSVPSLVATLDALAKRISRTPSAAEAIEACAMAQRALARGIEVELVRHAATRPWHIGLALRELDRRMTPDAIVTSDVSNIKLWVPLLVRAFGPASHLQSGSWGTMGYALPAAIGAALARPGQKVVALAGDTSFLMSSNDLVTLAQLKLPIVMAVHKDGRIGMIDYMQRQAGREPYAVEIGDVDLVKMAEAAGVRSIRVREPSEIAGAWADALAAAEPVLIEFTAGFDFPRPSVPRFVTQGAV
ncbi:MAG: thiamine pyrophosphate-binding protein [Chloroflexota bacterium]|nr:MAG: thiamine pyrophosphate-binding protein [Chloroflexota bacterium]